ncbi:tetratricopeptide repeat protein 19, mitochondrial-like [Pecten maximus]|uniref:tetratricopeptide repeat protein 19, mitochondrial-like n=1 Tax=Pecten maximus TaxID=6579 RepID=UPI001458E179|nr:tetratricopeptide repeat protein 19, mitochondrial-like [Pecten maximus]
MASSMFARGFRTLQVFTRNKNIFRKCSLYTNQSSKRFHQACNGGRTPAMIGVLAAAGVSMVKSDMKEDVKAEILLLMAKGKKISSEKRLDNSLLESAKAKAQRAFKRGQITEEERDIVVVLANKYIGEKFLEKGIIDKAESSFVEAMEVYKKLGVSKYDDASLELILRLTNCFALSGREVEAKDSFDMIIDTQLRKIRDSKTKCPLSTYQILWATLQLYGRFLVLNKDYDEAENMFIIADDVMQKASGEYFNGRQGILTDLAGVQIVKQDFTGAEATFEKAVKIGEKGNSPDVCFTYCYMADLATRMDNLKKATKMCNKGLQLAKEHGNKECLKKAELYLEKIQEAKEKR